MILALHLTPPIEIRRKYNNVIYKRIIIKTNKKSPVIILHFKGCNTVLEFNMGWNTLRSSTPTKPCPHFHRSSIWYLCYLFRNLSLKHIRHEDSIKKKVTRADSIVESLIQEIRLYGWKTVTGTVHCSSVMETKWGVQPQAPLVVGRTVCDPGTSRPTVDLDAAEMVENTWWVLSLQM